MRRLAAFVSGAWCLALLPFPLAAAGWLPFELALLIVLACASVAGFLALRGFAQASRGDSSMNVAVAAAALAALVFGALVWGVLRYPWLRDLSTDGDSPPRFAELVPRDHAAPRPVYDPAQREKLAKFKDLSSTKSSARREVMLGRALIAARTLPHWEMTTFDLKSGHMEGTTRSSLLGIPSQLAVTVRPEGRGSVLDVRSRSPILTGDFGANARVLRQFLEGLGKAAICTPSAEFMRRTAPRK